jgi:hypothetical protein
MDPEEVHFSSNAIQHEPQESRGPSSALSWSGVRVCHCLSLGEMSNRTDLMSGEQQVIR